MVFKKNRALTIILLFCCFLIISFFVKVNENGACAFLCYKLELLELKLYNIRLSKKAINPSKTLVAVPIDRESKDKLKVDEAVKREYYAKVIDSLSKDGAKVIAVDIAFQEEREPASTSILINSVKKANNVVLVCGYYTDDDGNIGFIPVIKGLFESSKFIGIPLAVSDIDNVYRRGCVLVPQRNVNTSALIPYHHFIFNILLEYLDRPTVDLPENLKKGFKIKDYNIPIKGNYKDGLFYYINFCKTGFNKVPFYNVYTGDYKKGIFKDKIVLIYDSCNISDSLRVPILDKIPGGEYHLHALNTILEKNFIKRASSAANWFSAVVLMALCAVIFIFFSLFRAVLIAPLVIIVYYFLNQWLFVEKGLWFDYVFGVFWFVILFAVYSIYESFRLKDIFSNFVPKKVLKNLLLSSDSLIEKGKTAVATILFSDIRGYTTMAEGEDPAVIMGLLNQYHQMTRDIVRKYKGTICDYQGDAEMIAFGVPEEYANHAQNAVLAAKEIILKLKLLNIEWEKENKPLIQIGIGIASGMVAYGLIGHEDYKQFAALGDTTNTAARLQALCKNYETSIILSENTYEFVKKQVDSVFLEEIILKGKTVSIKIYGVKV